MTFVTVWTLSSETMAAATPDAASQTGASSMHQDGHIHVWRHRGEHSLAACILLRHTGSSPGVMVWGAIGCTYWSPLVRTDGTLNTARYISVTTVDEQWHRVEASWASVPLHAIQSLFDSIPRRISAVILARGGCSENVNEIVLVNIIFSRYSRAIGRMPKKIEFTQNGFKATKLSPEKQSPPVQSLLKKS
ncbi:odorant receptor [Trichonephila clavipes]|nr:odorant receptor [Trichonephila clavipes]